MNKFIFWIGRKAANALVTAVFFILAVLGIVYASINWPTTTPSGETAGGKFRTEIDILKMLVDTKQKRVAGSCSVGQSIAAINADGTVSCGLSGGGGSIDYTNCTTIYHSQSMAIGTNCGGIITTAIDATCPTNYVLTSDSTGLRFPGVCVVATARCCKLQ
ncbi:TPA: hypothetical protein DCZ36_04025 [Candidatus Gracilibacteria bacterium]|nr:hypothetical protein [Candidatus Gracilibacteria bacterium]